LFSIYEKTTWGNFPNELDLLKALNLTLLKARATPTTMANGSS
jgi:hypothetical protein